MGARDEDASARRWRITDLARSAGVSTQQIRNYAEDGLLPAVARTDSGYRVFTARHADALVMLREMIDGHGWGHAPAIVRAVHRGDLETALDALDHSHAELSREREHVRMVLGAFETVVAKRPDTKPIPRGNLRIGEVSTVVGVRTSALRFWERRGLLRPSREAGTGYRVFSDEERRMAHVVALLRRGGYPFPVVESVLGELRSTGNPERVRHELAARQRELHRRSVRRLRASSALYQYLDQYAALPGGPAPAGAE
ncbi:MerR family transcriptional regulator [Phytoactinopolyspora alkaliphila]|uniref:MerR family transcriptional regulator n=1 Tax=Phytoactinopolyspora alkaliphila TaxID=1783498 RepID=A0A6N9YG52_9ACTN|nr:MerR family transcriptional regulator [Phytoactinopolyspora alkaliphila]